MATQTEKQFIDLLTTQWPEAPFLVKHTGLPRTCELLVHEAFIHEETGAAVDALRYHFERLTEGKPFDFLPKDS